MKHDSVTFCFGLIAGIIAYELTQNGFVVLGIGAIVMGFAGYLEGIIRKL